MVDGCGIDLVEIVRIERALKRFGQRFLNRIFTPDERTYCLARKRPEESLAARFAAKEAVAKALGLGLGEFCWQDIEIVRSDNGRPQVKLKGRALAQAKACDIGQVLISLSHTQQHAIAQAITIAKA